MTLVGGCCLLAVPLSVAVWLRRRHRRFWIEARAHAIRSDAVSRRLRIVPTELTTFRAFFDPDLVTLAEYDRP